MLVPVKPVCPNAVLLNASPDELGDGVSQPSARLDLSCWRFVNNAIVAGDR